MNWNISLGIVNPRRVPVKPVGLAHAQYYTAPEFVKRWRWHANFIKAGKGFTRKYWYEPQRGPHREKGYIGLQNHNEESVVYFKDLSVKPLD